jgi:hypothetical protein
VIGLIDAEDPEQFTNAPGRAGLGDFGSGGPRLVAREQR